MGVVRNPSIYPPYVLPATRPKSRNGAIGYVAKRYCAVSGINISPARTIRLQLEKPVLPRAEYRCEDQSPEEACQEIDVESPGGSSARIRAHRRLVDI